MHTVWKRACQKYVYMHQNLHQNGLQNSQTLGTPSQHTLRVEGGDEGIVLRALDVLYCIAQGSTWAVGKTQSMPIAQTHLLFITLHNHHVLGDLMFLYD